MPLPMPTATVFREYGMRDLGTPVAGTTASELLDHLRDEFDVPLHPHFVLRILELSIDLYQKRNEMHGPVMKLQVPGVCLDPGAVQVNVAETGRAGPSRTLCAKLRALTGFRVDASLEFKSLRLKPPTP